MAKFNRNQNGNTEAVETSEVPKYTPTAYNELEIANYRGKFPTETDKLSDKALFELVVSADDDLSDDDWQKLFAANQPPVESTIDGNALASHAATLAAKESKIMQSTFETLAKAREDWQGGPILTLLALRSTYSSEELDEFAVPGSETGNNPDKFKMDVIVGDKTTKRNTTFYAQFARATASGKAILSRLEMLDRAADKGAIKEGIPEDILNLSPEGRITHRSFLDGRINTMTQAYKKAMRLHFKLNEINEYNDAIEATPIWAEGQSPDDVENLWEAKLEPTNEPIAVIMSEEGKPPRWESFTIGAFLKLDTKKATEKGGGFRNLVDSGATKRIPPAPGTPAASAEAAKDVTIKSVDRSLGVVTELHRYFLNDLLGQRDRSEYGKLLQQISKKDADEYVTAFVELKNALVDLCRDTKLDAKYVKLKQAGSELISKAS